MRFALTDEQRERRQLVADRLAAACPPAAVRAAWTDRGSVSARWNDAVELGLVALLAPADADGLGLGLGLGMLDAALAAEAAGYAGFPGPLVDTAFVTVPLLGDPSARPLLAGVLDGTHRVAVRPPGSPYVADLDACDHVVIFTAPDRLGLYPADTCVSEPVPTTDRGRPLARLDGPPIESAVAGWEGPEALAAFERGALTTAAFLVGLGQRMLDLTVAYAHVREQFGRSIGSFQAVQHHLADCAVALAYARPLAWRAAWSLDTGHPDTSAHVSMCHLRGVAAASRCARAALQVHGAIGYTTEHDLHLFLKRADALASAWGDASFHRDRVAAALTRRADPKEYWDA